MDMRERRGRRLASLPEEREAAERHQAYGGRLGHHGRPHGEREVHLVGGVIDVEGEVHGIAGEHRVAVEIVVKRGARRRQIVDHVGERALARRQFKGIDIDDIEDKETESGERVEPEGTIIIDSDGTANCPVCGKGRLMP